MISHIHINNFGLIDELQIDLKAGLNIFTGETGVGKSILIDALRFCLGDRISGVRIRDKEKPCIIEAVFEIPEQMLQNCTLLREFVTQDELLLVIRRTRTPEGKTQNKINGLTVTLSQLKNLGDLLIDFHGPHDHQLLFSRESHLGLIDRFSPKNKSTEAYSEAFAEYNSIRQKLDRLKTMAQNRVREQDLLAIQIKDLEQVSLKEQDYQQLLAERSRINNFEKIFESAKEILELMENDDTGIRTCLSRAFAPLKILAGLDKSQENLLSLLENISQNSAELISELESYISSLSFEPEQADEINRIYTCYHEILRKYGPDLKNAEDFYNNAKERYNNLINLNQNTEDLEQKLARSRLGLEDLAETISRQRKKNAVFLKKAIERELKELGIINIRFECRVEPCDLGPSGRDSVEFYISPNLGEELKPLSQIISSGEAARVMLALKKALTDVDPVPVLIFDEIDAQIGGRLGTITGKKLKELSSCRQVILITHLPQIASFADLHLKVNKEVKNKRTLTKVSPLLKKERIQELAQMMSGKAKTKVSLEHAADMLANAEKPAASQQGIADSE